MVKYNLFLFFLWLLVIPAALIRLFTKKDTFQTIKNRFSFFTKSKNHKATIWCHAASVGEFNTLEILIPTLKENFKKHGIILTVSNIIAYEQAKQWEDEQINVTIAPLDFPIVVRRFITHWRPSALLTMENEIFPNRIALLKNAGCKVVWVNARISEKSINFWNKNLNLKKQIIKNIDHVFAQDKLAYQRFKKLGLSSSKLTQTENLKKFRSLPKVERKHTIEINKSFAYENTICVASSHPGEEILILDTFKLALLKNPDLKMIIVPRHPKRMQEIINLIKEYDFKYSVRSKNEFPSINDQIYLADTIGELPLWYSSCSTTFVAGSLLPIGGHTPFEPAYYSSTIIHGKHFSNFHDIYTQLDNNNGAIKAIDPLQISNAWEKLRNNEFRKKTLSNAQKILFSGSQKEELIATILRKFET